MFKHVKQYGNGPYGLEIERWNLSGTITFQTFFQTEEKQLLERRRILNDIDARERNNRDPLYVSVKKISR